MIRSLPQRIAGAAVFSLCIAVETSFAATPDYLTYDQPGTQLEDPLEEGLWTGSKPEKAMILPRLEEMSPFWRDTRLDLQLRTYLLWHLRLSQNFQPRLTKCSTAAMARRLHRTPKY